ncbi:GNAT family N-acetyltransferase [Paenibacillus sp. TAB 01]|uniref:GNAT family N-acetyltransferase n=1 Tax=Paenibacillus sp. TAB 01 TaxID=3368988 RepID=UPI003752F8A0
MNDTVIRAVHEQDIPQLLDLMVQYIVDFYNRPMPNEQSLENLIRQLLANPASGMQFCAERDGKLVGFATLYFTFSTLQVKRAAILNDLFVLTEARGAKLGEKLFQVCLAFVRENDFAYMTWETAKDNLIAQSLYNKMGGHLSEWVSYEMS